MSLIIARAIRSIDPDSRFSIQSGIVDWETSPIDQSLVDTEVARLQAEFDSKAYARLRQAEYPSIEECVHAILDDDLEALQAKRAEIKARYPK